MDFIPAGAEDDEGNDGDLPEYVLAQIGDNWNINNVQHIFDGNNFLYLSNYYIVFVYSC